MVVSSGLHLKQRLSDAGQPGTLWTLLLLVGVLGQRAPPQNRKVQLASPDSLSCYESIMAACQRYM